MTTNDWSTQVNREWNALRVVVVYAGFAGLWILLSDKALEWLFTDPAHIVVASTLKGLFFVVITSLLLYFLVRQKREGTESAGRHLQVFFGVLAATIVVLIAITVNQTMRREEDAGLERLQAIADLKSGQVADWLAERRNNAEFVSTSALYGEQFRRWQSGGDVAAGTQLQRRLDQFGALHGFAALTLVDSSGERLWSSTGAPAALAPPLREAIGQVSADGRIRHVGPYLGADGVRRLDFVTPLMVERKPSPVVVLHADPSAWLFATMRVWPVPEEVGETVLFRRAGDDALVLSELKHRPDAALNLRVPASDQRTLFARVLNGATRSGGVVEGVDERGVPSVGFVRSIPGTDWFLLAKVEQSRFFHDSSSLASWMVVSGLLVLLMLGIAMQLLRQRARLLSAASIHRSQSERLDALNLLGAIADTSEDAIYALDRNGHFKLFNRAAERLTGKSAQDVLGRDMSAVFPATEAQRLKAANATVMETGQTLFVEEEVSCVPGRRILLINGGPLKDEQDRIVGVYGISRDITERTRAEARLRESECRFQDIASVSADWIWEIDAQGRYTYVSDSVKLVLGYDPEEVIGRTPFDFMPHEEAVRVRARLAGIAAHRTPFHDLDNINVRKDGMLCHVQTHGTPIIAADGSLAGYRGVDRDVTDRKLDELALRESESRFRGLFDNAAVSIIVYDSESGEPLLANRTAVRAFGYETLEELRSAGIANEAPYTLEDAMQVVRAAAVEGSKRFEWKWRDRFGRVFWQDVQLNVFTLNSTPQVLSIAVDITARKNAEEEFRRQAEELKGRNQELERFNRATVGRELEMIDLKERVNALSTRLGERPPYPLAFLGTGEPEVIGGGKSR